MVARGAIGEALVGVCGSSTACIRGGDPVVSRISRTGRPRWRPTTTVLAFALIPLAGGLRGDPFGLVAVHAEDFARRVPVDHVRALQDWSSATGAVGISLADGQIELARIDHSLNPMLRSGFGPSCCFVFALLLSRYVTQWTTSLTCWGSGKALGADKETASLPAR